MVRRDAQHSPPVRARCLHQADVGLAMARNHQMANGFDGTASLCTCLSRRAAGFGRFRASTEDRAAGTNHGTGNGPAQGKRASDRDESCRFAVGNRSKTTEDETVQRTAGGAEEGVDGHGANHPIGDLPHGYVHIGFHGVRSSKPVR